MLAKEILRKINSNMSKTEMLVEVARAAADLELLDAHQVGQMLDVSHHTIRAWSSRRGIGEKMLTDGKWVYFPSDVETLRGLVRINRGHNPHTRAMVQKMQEFRDGGEKLREIGKRFGVTESYVSRLLRGENYKRRSGQLPTS